MANILTENEVEVEIERLRATEEVKLAKKEQRLRNRRRQALYQLRHYEKRGRELMDAGFTLDNIEMCFYGGYFDDFEEEV